MRRRSSIVLSMLLGLSILIAACGGDSGSENEPITWQVWADPEESEAYQSMIDAYVRDNPDAEVTLNAIPDRKTFLSRLSASFASGSPPDVFLVNYRHNGQFVEKGVLEPLGPMLEDSDDLSADQ
ncbi:MAG: extracellular solute-binding protein, partial [Thermomicrobiales bacterium]|nr:extracellular solute-binding protein [Thermomicrobiales bacterium]